jgi:hypothetical protein
MFSGCNKNTENEVAKFDNGNLTIEDLHAHARQLSMKKDFLNGRQELTPDYTFEHALNMEMLIAEGLERKLHLDPDVRQEIHAFMSNLFLKILKKELVPEIKSESISEEEIRAHYEQFRDSYSTPDKFDFSYAVFDDRQKAEKALAAGWKETDGIPSLEGALKQEKLESQSSSSMGKARKEVLKKLKTGEVSGITEDSGKFWIMKLEGMTAGKPYDFEKRKAYIRNDVLYAKYRKAWEDVYEKLKKEHEVKVNAEILEKFRKDFKDKKKAEEAQVVSGGTEKSGAEKTPDGGNGNEKRL